MNDSWTHLSVDDDGNATRLDKWLAGQLPDMSRARIQQLLEQGEITLNGKANPAASTKLKAGDALAVHLPEATPSHIEPVTMKLDIVFEDEHLLVINKPVGLSVHPGAGAPDATLVHGLLAHCGDSLSGIGGVQRPGIVHRLDKDTSGLIIVAKHDVAHRHLSEQLKDRSLSRTYHAITWGLPAPASGTIECWMGRDPKHRLKMKVLREGEGRDSVTHYQVLEAFNAINRGGSLLPIASLVECELETGRTHQIRLHFEHRHYPLIGDPLYSEPATTMLARRQVSPEHSSLTPVMAFKRQALHAQALRFIHPITEEEQEFSADLPDDMEGLVAALRQLRIPDPSARLSTHDDEE